MQSALDLGQGCVSMRAGGALKCWWVRAEWAGLGFGGKQKDTALTAAGLTLCAGKSGSHPPEAR